MTLSSKSRSTLSIVAFCSLLLVCFTACAKPAPEPDEVNTQSNIDVTVCAGEKAIGYISRNQETNAQFYTIGNDGSRSYGLGTCGCVPMGPAMQLWLWSCQEWPSDKAVDYGSITTLPYCTRLNYCFSFGQALSMDVSQKAKVCQGTQTVGLLYSTGQALPASGSSKDMVSGCSCSDSENGKSSVFTCDDPKAMKAFGQADKRNPFTCVNPLKACSGSESNPPDLGKS